VLAITFGLLFLYWISRIAFCRPSPALKVGYGFFALLSMGLFLALPKKLFFLPLLPVGMLLSFSFFKHFQKPRKRFRIGRLLGWSLLYFTGSAAALLSSVFQSNQENIVGHVILKGQDQSIWTTWKNPSQPHMASAWLPSYEVEVQDASGRKLYCDYIMGDFVAVRAQVITIDWAYHLLGFSHLCRLEMVHNGYATAERHLFFPHAAYPIRSSTQLLENIWNKLFTGSWKVPGIKSSTLESSFFPLREAQIKPNTRTYDLVIGSTGLSSRVSTHPGGA
jgi:hypothetical protein